MVSEHPLAFRPDIQGVRALAVLLVVLYHSGGIVTSGFVGVDMFFVISGYVIMKSVQRRLLEDGDFSITNFLARRVRRLFPALVVVIVTTMVLAPFLGTLSSRTQTLRTGLFSSLSAANVYLYRFRPNGYFESQEKSNALLHLWSLAIEEQFYLGFAGLLFVVCLIARRRNRPPKYVGAFVLIGSLSFLLCMYISQRALSVPQGLVRAVGNDVLDQDFNFYLPLTRAWEFIAGILLACVSQKSRDEANPLIRQIAVVMLLFLCLLFIDDSRNFPGALTLFPIALSITLIGRTPLNGFLGRALQSRWLTWIGDRSYSWYLWHWPIIQFVNPVFQGNKIALACASAASLVPAHLSYRFLERPIQMKSLRRSQMLALAAGPLVLASLAFLIAPNPSGELGLHLDAERGCESADASTVQRESRCTLTVKGSTGQAILVGDSHAGQLSEGFVVAAHELGLDATIAIRAGKPFLASAPGPIRSGDNDLLDAVLLQDPELVVIAQSRYPSLMPENTNWSDLFAPIVNKLQEEGVKVVVVNTSIAIGVEPRECSVIASVVGRCGADVVALRTTLDQQVSSTLEEERRAADESSVVLVDLLDVVCPSTECPARRTGKWVWRDSSHISRFTSEEAAPKLLVGMKSALGVS